MSNKVLTTLTDGRYYSAEIIDGFYYGRVIRGKYDEENEKLFVTDGFDEGFSIGVESLRIIG